MAGGHVHLVKFDVTASDGGSNGWNYQQAAFTKDQAELTGQQASGAVTCKAGAGFYGDASTGCRIPERDSWTPPKDSSGLWGQTIHERWYADYELRTAFTHDHHFAALVQNHGQYGALIVEPKGFDMRDPRTGDYHQPINDASHGTPCGPQCAGDADGEAVDLVGPGANDDYREFGLAIADFVPLVKRGGDPHGGEGPRQRGRRTGALPGQRPRHLRRELPQRAAGAAWLRRRHAGRPRLPVQLLGARRPDDPAARGVRA